MAGAGGVAQRVHAVAVLLLVDFPAREPLGEQLLGSRTHCGVLVEWLGSARVAEQCDATGMNAPQALTAAIDSAVA